MKPVLIPCLLAAFFLMQYCAEKPSRPPDEVVIAEKPEEVQRKIHEQLQELIAYIKSNNGKLNDSNLISHSNLLGTLYEGNEFKPFWSVADRWTAAGDSLFFLISKSRELGLFPSDYHFHTLLKIRNNIVTDSISRKNIALWGRADLLLSDAFLEIGRHLQMGHLPKDSITINNGQQLDTTHILSLFRQAATSSTVKTLLETLEPSHPGYKAIREAIPSFLETADFRQYTYVRYPNPDSLALIREVAKRLQEEGILSTGWNETDSLSYIEAVRKYQKQNGIRNTGVAAALTIANMNNTDWFRFQQLALNLDRYRQLPAKMPSTYIWVNLPAYKLTVVDMDTIALESKVIVGAAKTRTPVLNSQITNIITYPQWTVPYSIIFKEMLPKIRKDISYLQQQNLMVVDRYDSVINPAAIDWSKLNEKYFPYLIRQREGDDNSLGLMKFNFRNKYSVYLHDTNARGLFEKSNRALSHGCVRVKEWEKLAHFITRNDEIRYHPDTLRSWIGRQEKHVISDFENVPIYIRYFTVDAIDGKLQFLDDIYSEDKMLAERYFKSKPIN
ncbi:hypothetical protein HY58_03885 [Flavihumibacter sp. ZG627]|nr:hypothetical protein HY58_03885 [Flavihumibacter sp. ZG627]